MVVHRPERDEAAIGGILTSDRVPLSLVVEQMVSQVQSFPLIAIPFFILTGALMMGGRLGKTLWTDADAGDKVRVELSPYDLTRGRITFRLK